ncbi:putative DNA-mediated transposase [Operophtera brumata]|uniref:Putative DNA-mediated transposase n=1 Tax=Operophtera brumata TaxID=104452 RepID=A0A0L7L6Y6_OPEBR|nr:putative DNA-mediated transposase [Operophtera brumata]
MDLSKWRYKILRDFNAKEGITNYPSYYAIVKEKSLCYPPKEDVSITENSAKIKMQALLDLPTKRLLKSLAQPIIGNPELVLVSKWGLDGSSSQSTYHQRTSTGN